jgi:hypothetical protein
MPSWAGRNLRAHRSPTIGAPLNAGSVESWNTLTWQPRRRFSGELCQLGHADSRETYLRSYRIVDEVSLFFSPDGVVVATPSRHLARLAERVCSTACGIFSKSFRDDEGFAPTGANASEQKPNDESRADSLAIGQAKA